jgi:hypothetical protein
MYSNGNGTASLSLDGLHTRRLNARQKACLAAIVLVEPGPFKPTMNQLAIMLHVTPHYIAVARQLPPEKRQAILSGHDTSSFVPRLHAPSLTLPGNGDAFALTFDKRPEPAGPVEPGCRTASSAQVMPASK